MHAVQTSEAGENTYKQRGTWLGVAVADAVADADADP